jgi:hypothetical protein
MVFGHWRIRLCDWPSCVCLEVVAVKFVELRIQLDHLELFLSVRRCCRQRHTVGRLGGGLLVGHRLDA